MNPKDKAIELLNKYSINHPIICKRDSRNMYKCEAQYCALIAVTEIINSNPYSNPFNTDIHSTMQYWIEVKNEIEKL